MSKYYTSVKSNYSVVQNINGKRTGGNYTYEYTNNNGKIRAKDHLKKNGIIYLKILDAFQEKSGKIFYIIQKRDNKGNLSNKFKVSKDKLKEALNHPKYKLLRN